MKDSVLRDRYPFSASNFILDAVARSFAKCCIGHAGYAACEKCTVFGEYSHGRVNFSNVGPQVVARTDDSYRNRTDRSHHTGQSPLEMIGIGMVSQFRLDPMHLLDRGAFRRFLEAVNTWDGPWRLDADTVEEITAVLLQLEKTKPRDFNRPQRSFKQWDKYKCTELRRLRLYDALIAFKGSFHKNIYDLYLLLHCAVYILSSSYLLPLYVDEAEKFLTAYVNHCRLVFGDHFTAYNPHLLVHLASECRVHGVLDSFSAYIYENELKSIKCTLKSGYKPLEQLAIREFRKKDVDVTLKSQENVVQLFHTHELRGEVEPGRQYCIQNCSERNNFCVRR